MLEESLDNGHTKDHVDIKECITLLLANGSSPEEVLHWGYPDMDEELGKCGVHLDRSHRTLLRTAIRAYKRDLRAQNGTLTGWDSGHVWQQPQKSKVTHH